MDDIGELAAYEIGDRTSPFGSGGMRSKVAAAEMATAAGIEVVVCDGTEDGTLDARGRRRGRRDAVPRASGAGAELQAVAALREAGHGARSRSTRAPRACCASRARACCPSGTSGSTAASRPAMRSRSSATATLVGKGIVNYSAGELGRIKGMKSSAVQELMPHAAEEAVHRDFFVLA